MEHQRASRASGNGRRRRRIPAFGEWNHYDDDGNGEGWPAAATTTPPFFDLAAPHKPTQTEVMRDGVVVAEAKSHGRRRSKVADAGSSGDCAARKACFTVVAPKAKAVDDDLYGVPSDILFRPKPAARRRGWLRILLATSCFCPRGTCMA